MAPRMAPGRDLALVEKKVVELQEVVNEFKRYNCKMKKVDVDFALTNGKKVLFDKLDKELQSTGRSTDGEGEEEAEMQENVGPLHKRHRQGEGGSTKEKKPAVGANTKAKKKTSGATTKANNSSRVITKAKKSSGPNTKVVTKKT
ncbi:unnamed protein product [Calypogeia fissa]